MIKHILSFTIFLTLLTACTPSPEQLAAQTATVQTAIAAAWTSTPQATNTTTPTPTIEPTITSSPTSTEIPLPQTLEMTEIDPDLTEAQRQAVENGKNSKAKAGIQSWWEYWLANGMPDEFKGATITPVFDSLNQIGADGKDSVNPWLSYAIQTSDGRMFVPPTVFGEIVDPLTATVTTPIELTGGPEGSTLVLRANWCMRQGTDGQITEVLNVKGQWESPERYIKLWEEKIRPLEALRAGDRFDLEKDIHSGDLSIAVRIKAEPFSSTVDQERNKVYRRDLGDDSFTIDWSLGDVPNYLKNPSSIPIRMMGYGTSTQEFLRKGSKFPLLIGIQQRINPNGKISFLFYGDPARNGDTFKRMVLMSPMFNMCFECVDNVEVNTIIQWLTEEEERIDINTLTNEWITSQEVPIQMEQVTLYTLLAKPH